MRNNPSPDSSEWSEAASDETGPYTLKLYVSGTTVRSLRAIRNLHTICEEHLQGRYDLEVIDLYQEPQRASTEQLVALPTLIKELPLPLSRIIGDLSDTERVLVGLDLQPRHSGS